MDKDIGADKFIGVAVLRLATLKDEAIEGLTLDLASKLEVDNAIDNDICGSISISVSIWKLDNLLYDD